MSRALEYVSGRAAVQRVLPTLARAAAEMYIDYGRAERLKKGTSIARCQAKLHGADARAVERIFT